MDPCVEQPEVRAFLAHLEDLEDLLSVYEARVDGPPIPWREVKAAAGLTP